VGRFAYYRRLTKRQRAIYRKSDELTDVPLRELREVRALADKVRRALEVNDRVECEEAAQALVSTLTAQLAVAPALVRVHATRPRSASSELHGLYSFEDGKPALIQVWMRTAGNRQVVKYRTFLRTLLHEVGHHLDYHFFGLADSYHTEGFFRRESSMMRQVAGGRPQKPQTSRSEGRGEGSHATRPSSRRVRSAAQAGARRPGATGPRSGASPEGPSRSEPAHASDAPPRPESKPASERSTIVADGKPEQLELFR
jgi:hypothetical protein